MGYNISKNTIKPVHSRTQAVRDFPIPTNRKQLRSFLGHIRYDREFVEKVSETAQELYRIKDADKFEMTELAHKNFASIKEKWSNDLETYIPNDIDTYTLETDASNMGIGAVLLQKNKPVAYINRTLSKAEKNYSVTDKEILAAMWAMKRLEYLLLGKQFQLITDHKAFEAYNKKTDFGTARMNRWHERLNRFNITVKYRTGKEMYVADTLSRVLKEEEGADDLEEECRIMKLHEENGHRKNYKYIKSIINPTMTVNQIKNIIRKCKNCKQY